MTKMMIISTMIIANYLILAGHEVLYNYQLSASSSSLNDDDLNDHNIAIIQYDSRSLSSYWNTSIRWNKAYCDKYGHEYIFLSSHHHQICRYDNSNDDNKNDNNKNASRHRQILANPWCKVRAMIEANNMMMSENSNVKAILFLDSDALITVNYSMATVISNLWWYIIPSLSSPSSL